MAGVDEITKIGIITMDIEIKKLNGGDLNALRQKEETQKDKAT